MKITQLNISWSVSRGRDTYGYNICRLDDASTGKRYRCDGGGYDMVGTVFGDWLTDVHQDKIKRLDPKQFYGLRIHDDGSAYLDGACGIDCMVRVAEAIGLEVQGCHNKLRHSTGYLIVEGEQA